MLNQEIIDLYKKFRLMTYRSLFGRIREKDGSLSATEAYAVDVIFLLENPTVTQLAELLGISQPNATYKANNLVSKGYVAKTVSEDDKRECRLQVADRFYKYYGDLDHFIDKAIDALESEYSPEELALFERMLHSLAEHVE
ncbi:MAG: MarR family transcriptional regulator [Oscillospiraceae bacterium]|nr:MarR family transcriptional regulator [Oscillospiraceae bacterium]